MVGTPAGGRIRDRARWLDSRAVGLVLGAIYLVGLTALVLAWGRPGHAMDEAAGPFMFLYAVAAAVLAARAGTHRALSLRLRRAWLVMAAAFVVLGVAYLAFAATETQAFPTIGDALRLLFVLVLLPGLLMLPIRAHTRRELTKLALDIGVVLAGGAMLLWYLMLGWVVTGAESGLAAAVGAAYPIGDLVLIFGATYVLFRSAGPTSRVPLLLLSGAVMCLVVGDVYLGYQRANAPTGEYVGWQFVGWLTGSYLMAAAVAEQCRRAGGPAAANAERQIREIPRLPYAAVAMGYVVLLWVASGLPLYPYGGLIIGAVAMTCLVVARQIVALRENHLFAITDNLTGLANRTLLRHELSRALDRARRTREPIGVLLIDLNGFKQINDSLGHEAGDQMLVAFARLLERSVRRTDCVARLGGDEFAVVVDGGDAATSANMIAQRISDGSNEPVTLGGHPTRPRASIGIAISDPVQSTVSNLLHRADAEMYRAKRASAGQRADSPGMATSADRRGELRSARPAR
ncbi:MAG TPA: GGDEF domain-containing protein [Micromonosporaceae bacterium]|nr:GGDEF domain-containing protein [Micromonosporaceae bacterium]